MAKEKTEKTEKEKRWDELGINGEATPESAKEPDKKNSDK